MTISSIASASLTPASQNVDVETTVSEWLTKQGGLFEAVANSYESRVHKLHQRATKICEACDTIIRLASENNLQNLDVVCLEYDEEYAHALQEDLSQHLINIGDAYRTNSGFEFGSADRSVVISLPSLQPSPQEEWAAMISARFNDYVAAIEANRARQPIQAPHSADQEVNQGKIWFFMFVPRICIEYSNIDQAEIIRVTQETQEIQDILPASRRLSNETTQVNQAYVALTYGQIVTNIRNTIMNFIGNPVTDTFIMEPSISTDKIPLVSPTDLPNIFTDARFQCIEKIIVRNLLNVTALPDTCNLSNLPNLKGLEIYNCGINMENIPGDIRQALGDNVLIHAHPALKTTLHDAS